MTPLQAVTQSSLRKAKLSLISLRISLVILRPLASLKVNVSLLRKKYQWKAKSFSARVFSIKFSHRYPLSKDYKIKQKLYIRSLLMLCKAIPNSRSGKQSRTSKSNQKEINFRILRLKYLSFVR